MLRVELVALEEEGFNLDVVGFTEDEIEDLLRDPEEDQAGNTDDDSVPETPETAGSASSRGSPSDHTGSLPT